MKRYLRSLVVPLAGLALLGAACCPCRKHKPLPPLAGTSWQLVQLGGRDRTPQGDAFTLVFAPDGRISGVGSCNRMTGTFTESSDGSLKISLPAVTRMACEEPEQERAYIEMLSKIDGYRTDPPMLLLYKGDALQAVLEAR